jgi:FkbM family methyltransferase
MNTNSEQNTISPIDTTIKVYHVGGRGGGIGPMECLFHLKDQLHLTTFEADIEGNGDTSWVGEFENWGAEMGIRVSIVQKCLYNHIGRKKFHINVMPDCSSLLSISPDAQKYQRLECGGQCRLPWVQICQPTHTIELEVTTLDELQAKQNLAMPDFLSLDVQGAEYEILEGASKCLYGDVLGVITEVEFRELYEGQKLFADQNNLLKKHHFDLFELYSIEHWYSGPIIGKGALVVAEALFLRDYRYYIDKNTTSELLCNLSKLAMIARCFDRGSYAYEILDYITNNLSNEWDNFVRKNNCDYLQYLKDFYKDAKAFGLEQNKQLPTWVDYQAMVSK